MTKPTLPYTNPSWTQSLFAGKTIKTSVEDGRGHIHLWFTDGTSVEIEGLGYDGLWDSVVITEPATYLPQR